MSKSLTLLVSGFFIISRKAIGLGEFNTKKRPTLNQWRYQKDIKKVVPYETGRPDLSDYSDSSETARPINWRSQDFESEMDFSEAPAQAVGKALLIL